MQSVSVASAKAHFSELLDKVEQGEEITITRNGKAVATLYPADRPKNPLDLARLDALRNTMPVSTQTSVELMRQIRESRY